MNAEIELFKWFRAKGQALRSGGKFESFPAIKVDAIDTTGAGDSFAGAFVDGEGIKTHYSSLRCYF